MIESIKRQWKVFAGLAGFLLLFYILRDIDWNRDGQPDGRFVEFAYAAISLASVVVMSLWIRSVVFERTLGDWIKNGGHRNAFDGLSEPQKFLFYASVWFVLLIVGAMVFGSILGK